MTQRGGKRQGSGRPCGTGLYGVKTKPIRVPEDRVLDVLQFLQRKTLVLPLYSSSVQAGFPSPATDDQLEGYLDLNAHLIKNPDTTFYARVAGDSMINAGIFNNDLLVVDRSLEPVHGKIVVAVINGEMTIKRLHKTADSCWLMAENPDYPPIKLKADDDMRIWGVVTSVVKIV